MKPISRAFGQSLAAGMTHALVTMWSRLLLGPRSYASDVAQAIEVLVSMGLLERLPNGQPRVPSRLCELLRPHMTAGFPSLHGEQDVALPAAVVAIAACAYSRLADAPERQAALVRDPGWLPTIAADAAIATRTRLARPN
jgi:hypothetical protein